LRKVNETNEYYNIFYIIFLCFRTLWH